MIQNLIVGIAWFLRRRSFWLWSYRYSSKRFLFFEFSNRFNLST